MRCSTARPLSVRKALELKRHVFVTDLETHNQAGDDGGKRECRASDYERAVDQPVGG